MAFGAKQETLPNADLANHADLPRRSKSIREIRGICAMAVGVQQTAERRSPEFRGSVRSRRKHLRDSRNSRHGSWRSTNKLPNADLANHADLSDRIKASARFAESASRHLLFNQLQPNADLANHADLPGRSRTVRAIRGTCVNSNRATPITRKQRALRCACAQRPKAARR
jgi:hypothetical protein